MLRSPYVPKRPALDPCPVEEVLAMIGGKWKARMLLPLSQGPHRLSSLRRALPAGVSNEVLITQLRGLAADGLVEVTVERKGATSFRRYTLTPLGQSLCRRSRESLRGARRGCGSAATSGCRSARLPPADAIL